MLHTITAAHTRQETTQAAEDMQQKDHSRMLQKSGYLTTISASAGEA